MRRLLGARLARGGEARPPSLEAAAAITLRLADPGEEPAIDRLAELSGRSRLSGPYLVADVDGHLCAALPLSGGEPVADPFRPLMELKALLSLRVAQLDASDVAWGGEASADILPLPCCAESTTGFSPAR